MNVPLSLPCRVVLLRYEGPLPAMLLMRWLGEDVTDLFGMGIV